MSGRGIVRSGNCPVGELSGRGIVRSGNCPVGELSGRGIVRSGNCPVGELSGRGIVRSGNCPVGELSGRGIVRSGNCPVGELSGRGIVRSGNCPDTEKRVIAHQHKRKRLEMLIKFKEMKGPLTNANEVEIFLNDTKVSNELKAKRLKLEMKFARDSSTTLPKSDRIFRIQVTLPNKKRLDKSAVEYADSLMASLGRKTEKSI